MNIFFPRLAFFTLRSGKFLRIIAAAVPKVLIIAGHPFVKGLKRDFASGFDTWAVLDSPLRFSASGHGVGSFV